MVNLLNIYQKRTREYLTRDELEKLLSASRNPENTRNPARDYCMLLLMFRHGLRVSELCALRLSDVNVEAKELHVKRLKGSDSGAHQLYNIEVPAVKAWLAERAKMNVPEDCETLFVSERRKPMNRRTVWVMIDRLAAAAGLKGLDIHPHMLRHSCGYDLINKGTDVRIMQDYLGHRSISTTVRYTRLNRERFASLF
jgi:site-specific recombinase XerD